MKKRPVPEQYLTTLSIHNCLVLRIIFDLLQSTQSKPVLKIAIYCPQGSGTLRQQLLMMH